MSKKIKAMLCKTSRTLTGPGESKSEDFHVEVRREGPEDPWEIEVIRTVIGCKTPHWVSDMKDCVLAWIEEDDELKDAAYVSAEGYFLDVCTDTPCGLEYDAYFEPEQVEVLTRFLPEYMAGAVKGFFDGMPQDYPRRQPIIESQSINDRTPEQEELDRKAFNEGVKKQQELLDKCKGGLKTGELCLMTEPHYKGKFMPRPTLPVEPKTIKDPEDAPTSGDYQKESAMASGFKKLYDMKHIPEFEGFNKEDQEASRRKMLELKDCCPRHDLGKRFYLCTCKKKEEP